MIYIYRTYFNLTGSVNDYDAAYEYLTEDNMTSYLLDDDDILMNTRNAIISIRWELENDNSGYIELKTKRELTEAELAPISDWIGGQNSDGLGEGFEQQDFADDFNEDDYEYDRRNWDEAYEEGEDEYDDLSPEEQEEYGDKDDYAYQYARENSNSYDEPNEDDYHQMVSFDWQNNSYKLELYETTDDE